MSLPICANGPLSGAIIPILIGPWASASSPTRVRTPRASARNHVDAARRHFIDGSSGTNTTPLAFPASRDFMALMDDFARLARARAVTSLTAAMLVKSWHLFKIFLPTELDEVAPGSALSALEKGRADDHSHRLHGRRVAAPNASRRKTGEVGADAPSPTLIARRSVAAPASASAAVRA